MRKNTVIKFIERHSSETHNFDVSPVRDIRLDFLSFGKTVGCLVGTVIDIPAILNFGGNQKLRAVLENDSLLVDLQIATLLTGHSQKSDEFDGQWLPSIVSQAHKFGIKPHTSGVLFIRMIEADRFLRGTGIAHHLIQHICQQLGDEFPLVLLEACPVDYQLDMTCQELYEGQMKLESHYMKMGFVRTEEAALVGFSQALAGVPLKPDLALSGKQELQLVS